VTVAGDRVRRVAVVAHDAGGARAVFPVAEELTERGHQVTALVSGPATSLWNGPEPPLGLVSLADDTPVGELGRVLGDLEVELMLSAAGLYNHIEHRARVAARRLGLPVTALLDSWGNYRERFERGGESSLPDRVCVMEEHAREAMIATGMARDRVVVTGHPGLERATQAARGLKEEDRRRLRAEMGLAPGALVVAFFSDPFFTGPGRQFYSGPGAIMGRDGRGLLGYTVEDIIPAVVEELEAALASCGGRAEMIVRPHPAEDVETLAALVRSVPSERLQTRLLTSHSTPEWIAVGDVAVGMMTLALLEAALSGKPAISVQLGLEKTGAGDPCLSNWLGYSVPVFDRSVLVDVCRRIVNREWDALRPIPHQALRLSGSTIRVADATLAAGPAARPEAG
jgi:hypothetical protein